MKFARELEESLVAEWKVQHPLGYNKGKQKLRVVAKALRTVDRLENAEKRATVLGAG